MQNTFTAFFVLFFVGTNVLANSNETPTTPVVKNLDEVVVTGTGTPHHLKTAPVPTELYTQEEIENVGATDFKDLMSKLSPSFDFTPNGMGHNMQLNGLGNDYIVILIDGKRLSGDVGGMNDLDRINMADVERIEVVKGASSSLYGSDAIGGVINIITKKSKDKISFRNYSNYSNYTTLQQDNTLSYNVGKLYGKTHFAYNHTDGWQNSPYELDDDTLIESSVMTQNASDNITLEQSLRYNITDKLSISGDVSAFKKDLHQPLDVKKYGYLYEDLNYTVAAKYAMDNYDQINASFHSDRYTYSYKYNQASGDYVEGDEVEQNQQIRTTANVSWNKSLTDNNTLTLGSEYVGETYISDGRVEGGEASNYTAALYAQDEHTFFDALDVIAGLRLTQHQDFGTNLTPKLSLLYRLNQLNLRGTYSRGFKAPTLKELNYRYEKSGKLYLGNQDLSAQTSDYYTIGADYYNSFLSASVSAYINNVDGMIRYEIVETTPEDEADGIKTTKQHFNLDKAETKGFEASFNLKLAYGFSIGAAYSYVDAVGFSKEEDGTFTEERLEYVAKHYLNANLNYAKSWANYKLNLSFTAKMQDDKYYSDGNAPGFKMYNLSSTHKLAQMGIVTVTATAGIDNVFNYIDATPYRGNRATVNPGRTFYGGLIIQLSDK